MSAAVGTPERKPSGRPKEGELRQRLIVTFKPSQMERLRRLARKEDIPTSVLVRAAVVKQLLQGGDGS